VRRLFRSAYFFHFFPHLLNVKVHDLLFLWCNTSSVYTRKERFPLDVAFVIYFRAFNRWL